MRNYLYFNFITSIISGLFISAISLAEGIDISEKEKISVITSFGPETTVTFKQAFENKYPNIGVEIIHKKTNNGIKFIEKNRKENKTDIFWASSPDAFEVLKDKGLLRQYDKKNEGIPKTVGNSFINDPEGYYKGFAASGYGFMENSYYTTRLGLPPAREWDDLKSIVYKEHIGMSAPSRSGTTHLTIEMLLQEKGWKRGWMLWKEIAGNIKKITPNSFSVPQGVNKGEFGIGIVIDYYGLSYKALGFPINFTYPKLTTLLPASIAIIKDAPNVRGAKAFIDFILSDTGQKILLKEKISRLPINPQAYVDMDRNFPNPFMDKNLGTGIRFNTQLSKNRYNVVNSLFDVMITYNLDELKAAINAIQIAEKILKRGSSSEEALQRLAQARELIAWMPIDENKALQRNFNAIFTKSRKTKLTVIKGEQAKVELEWDKQIKKNYAQAVILAERALWN